MLLFQLILIKKVGFYRGILLPLDKLYRNELNVMLNFQLMFIKKVGAHTIKAFIMEFFLPEMNNTKMNEILCYLFRIFLSIFYQAFQDFLKMHLKIWTPVFDN